jgi:hypothetical protein
LVGDGVGLALGVEFLVGATLGSPSRSGGVDVGVMVGNIVGLLVHAFGRGVQK